MLNPPTYFCPECQRNRPLTQPCEHIEIHPDALQKLQELQRPDVAAVGSGMLAGVVDRDHLHRQPAVITARYALNRAQHLLPVERRAVISELNALDSFRARLDASAAHLSLCRSALDSLRARQPITEAETAALVTLLELAAVGEL